MNVRDPDRATIVAAGGYGLVLAAVLAVGDIPGGAGAAILAVAWVVLAPATVAAAVTVVTATVLPTAPSGLVLAGLLLGGVVFVLGATARPDHLSTAAIGTGAIAFLLAAAGLAGWAQTTTLWGTVLAMAAVAVLVAYTLHRYSVALTEAPP